MAVRRTVRCQLIPRQRPVVAARVRSASALRRSTKPIVETVNRSNTLSGIPSVYWHTLAYFVTVSKKLVNTYLVTICRAIGHDAVKGCCSQLSDKLEFLLCLDVHTQRFKCRITTIQFSVIYVLAANIQGATTSDNYLLGNILADFLSSFCMAVRCWLPVGRNGEKNQVRLGAYDTSPSRRE